MEKQRKGNKKTAVTIGCMIVALLSVLCLCLGLGFGTGKAEESKTQPVKTVSASTVATMIFQNTETEYSSFATAWQAAMDASTSAENRATVKMYKDVVAVDGGFGIGSSGYVPVEGDDHITLDLNGCKLDRALTTAITDGCVIKIGDNGDFTLDDTSAAGDGEVTGGNASGNGGGVFASNATFTMNGGSITANKANTGGGVSVSSGTFTMNGGSIIGNEGYILGGGVAANKFTMNDGKIMNNQAATEAGGVYTFETFTMNGGIITGNTAVSSEGSGGGVDFVGTFVMNGGRISENTAKYGGGVYINRNGDKSLKIDGDSVISGNKSNQVSGDDTPVYNDIYFEQSNEDLLEFADNFQGNIGNIMIDIKGDYYINDAVIKNYKIFTQKPSFSIALSDASRDDGYELVSNTYYLKGNDLYLVFVGKEPQSYQAEFTVQTATPGAETVTYRAATLDDAINAVNRRDSWEQLTINLITDVVPVMTEEIDAEADVVLDLAGHTATLSGVAFGAGFTVNGKLKVIDSAGHGKITGANNGSGSGGAFYVNGGDLTLNGVEISGNKAANGGAISVSGGSLTIEATTISGNTATSGGGVYVASGSLEVTATAAIRGNIATSGGGGIYIAETGTAHIYGGLTSTTITGNTAGNGGGVYNLGELYLNGNITGNSGGGIYQGGNLYVVGESNVTGNTTGSVNKNIQVPTGKTITVDSEANTANTKFGVTCVVAPIKGQAFVVTSGDVNAVAMTVDNTGFDLVTKGGQYAVAVPTSLTIGEPNEIFKIYDGLSATLDSGATYGDADFECVWYKVVGDRDAVPGEGDDTVVESATGSTLTFVNVTDSGHYYCVVTAYANGVMKESKVSETMIVSIQKCALTIRADNKSIVAGEKALALTFSLDRMLIGTDSLSGELACELDPKNPGEYKITLGTLNNDNYDITFMEGIYTVKSDPLFIPLVSAFGAIAVLFIGLTIWVVAGHHRKPTAPIYAANQKMIDNNPNKE